MYESSYGVRVAHGTLNPLVGVRISVGARLFSVDPFRLFDQNVPFYFRWSEIAKDSLLHFSCLKFSRRSHLTRFESWVSTDSEVSMVAF